MMMNLEVRDESVMKEGLDFDVVTTMIGSVLKCSLV
jgi:hypothetical protein